MQGGSFLGAFVRTIPRFTSPVSSNSIFNNFLTPGLGQSILLQPPQNTINNNQFEIPENADTSDQSMELMAVPKKRTTYTKNKLRNSSKKYKLIHHHTVCVKCSSPKLRHHICLTCLKRK